MAKRRKRRRFSLRRALTPGRKVRKALRGLAKTGVLKGVPGIGDILQGAVAVAGRTRAARSTAKLAEPGTHAVTVKFSDGSRLQGMV